MDYFGFAAGVLFVLKLVADELREAGVNVDVAALHKLAGALVIRDQRAGAATAIEILEG
jgi:hypothetical protein